MKYVIKGDTIFSLIPEILSEKELLSSWAVKHAEFGIEMCKLMSDDLNGEEPLFNFIAIKKIKGSK